MLAAALTLFGVTQAGQAATGRYAAAATPAAAAAPASTVPAWTGTFDNFHTAPWIANWGTTSDTAQCQGASGTFGCNWGYGNLAPVTDSSAPGSGQALKATYPANSGPPSCYLSVSGCVLGGGQFYQDLTTNGQTALANSPSLDLKYDYSFPVGFDFGGKTQGKMPGLWGGGVMGCESGAQHCASGWSTRYMWKGGSSSAPNGELYFYTASGSGYGADLCNGNWTFAADGKWHSIEQLTNVSTGSITIWSDGRNVCQVTEPMPGAHSGVFFSTFHGGHDLSYSPKKTENAEFADFSLATDGPQTPTSTGPATPTALSASASSSSSIALNWTETNTSDAAASYHVYEGSTKVATVSGTSATITGLAAGSTHTYTVTAVDGSGVESAHSTAATATTPSSTNTPATPTKLAVSGTTSSSISLSWTETDNADPAASYQVLEGSTVVATSTGTSATVGGLTAGSTHTYTVEALDAAGNASAASASATGTTSNPSTVPAVPQHVVVASATSSSITLNWTETNTSDAAASYDVYEGTSRVATSKTTSATVTGLAAGSTHTYTVTAVDAAGNESAHSAAATGSTTGGGGGGLTVTIKKTKDWGSGYTDTATLTNTSGSAVTGWDVQFDLDKSENIESSAGVSYASSANHYTLTNDSTDATLAAGASLQFKFSGDYGSGGYIAPTNVAAYPLSGQPSPATPTGLTVTGTTTSSISLSWTETDNSDPAASYTVSEGGVPVATVPTTSATIAGLAAGSTHTYTVTAVDASGNGSAASAPVTATTDSGGPGTPATPTGLTVTGTTSSSISLSWTETDNGDPAASYQVLEGSTVVASPSATSATISGLTAGSTHTYTVVAVDAAGAASAASSPVTGTTQAGSTTPATPTALMVSGTTSSSITLSWTENDNADPAASYNVLEGSTVVVTSSTTSVTVGGLAAGSSHTYTVEAVDSAGNTSAPSASVTGSTSGGGGPNPFTQSLIDSAVAAAPFNWAAPTSSVPRPGTNPANIAQAKVLYYLALVDKVAPGSAATSGTSVRSALLTQIRSLIAGGHEPDADGGLEMWGQAPVAQALLLLKNDGSAWSQLSSAEQNKVTLLEAAMGYGSNYAYNDANSFSSGICGFGNFSKTNNPNYRDGGVDTEIAAIQFFGASTWDGMLSAFNDATFTGQLNAAGLTSAGQCFAAVGSGGNSAIARPFVYSGHHSSDLMGIWSTIAGNTFDKTAQSTVSPAHIADGTTSPYDGQCCMGHEFNSTDSQGLRSSALYTFEGWMNVTGSRVTMEVLGNFNLSAASTETQYHIGTLDLKYKLDHGYISHALNQSDILVDDHGSPATDGPNAKGFLYDWDAYTVSGAPNS
ncbi:fibronectin type III domain-containing protein [Catenulispora rubra]|uniref:fibronectin type III domain-containing protein n=1 Tax=Catenulispora rubra TaxID=280293 RepID=UPI00189245D0|nr:fibronectin type III domain-containing protein [Catenulispora rubra]